MYTYVFNNPLRYWDPTIDPSEPNKVYTNDEVWTAKNPSSSPNSSSSVNSPSTPVNTDQPSSDASAAEKRDAILNLGNSLIGKIPYKLPPDTGTVNYNTNGIPSNQDCSAFTSSLYKVGIEVSGDYEIGDLIITDGGGHVGIYAGEGMLLHEGPAGKSSPGNVKLTSLIYMNVVGARRIIQNDGTIVVK